MEAQTIRSTKKGEYITLKPIANPKPGQVWIKDSYDRETERYMLVNFADISKSKLVPGHKLCYTDFTF